MSLAALLQAPVYTPSARSYFKHLIKLLRRSPEVFCPLLPRTRAFGSRWNYMLAPREEEAKG